MPKVNPNILKWAREKAGLTIEEAVKKLLIKDTHVITATEKLDALEKGIIEPSRSILIRMSNQYRRPLIVFYMSSPPRRGDRGEDYRTLPRDYSQFDDYLIDTLIRNIRARQSMVKAALEDDEDVESIDFIGSYKISDGLGTILNSLRDIIKLDIKEFRSQPNSSDAFSFLRDRVQEIGIYVLLIGDLGNYLTSIDVDIFRGFALSDNLAPFIVINDQDSHSAWSFTLIHELVHILLGQTGISGWKSDLEIENFCDEVAGEFLLPLKELSEIKIDTSSSLEYMKVTISRFAKERNISSTLVAYKLYKTGIIKYNSWNTLYGFYRKLWLDERSNRRQKARESEGGPNYYIIRRYKIGTPLINLVYNLMTSGSLSTSKAGKILGVKSKKVQSLFDTIHQSNVAFRES